MDMAVDRLDAAIGRANALTRQMIEAYEAWGSRIQVGEVQQYMYNELIDFVNFRVETAQTCLLLVEGDRIADALGLCRSLLENCLLHMLRCRGYRYFRLLDRTDLTESEFKAYLADEQRKNQEAQARGDEKAWISVQKYARAKRHVMYVSEGLLDPDDAGFRVPVHYFYFQQFKPEFMRLKRDDYFEYLPILGDEKKPLDEIRQNVTLMYRFYLSYDALLQCLELNDLADDQAIKRIEAHYTFLGKFIHPTHNAARELHEQHNWHGGAPIIGMDRPYAKTAKFLASLYVCYLIAGLLDETALLHESAPERYIQDPGTTELRQLTAMVPQVFPYFWFLYNKPPLYDKYQHATNYLTEEQWQTLGGYQNVPDDDVVFNQDIYRHLQDALDGWWNARCGQYTSPLA
ncbi:MAG TPA: hypothetical protein VFX16_28770 [Pseudonocardiaceae bacterium]|nr:hypothetical protein [Pseudonocardiaceae bacterium]